MRLRLDISPCPNDTFMFDAMINGRVDTEGIVADVRFGDIEQLNRRVLAEDTDVSKVSYAVVPAIAGRYGVLESGSALGRGNGPLLVSRGDIDVRDPSLRIALPGEHTTANLLMRRLYPHLENRTQMLFSEIAGRVADGGFDAGVLIHEGRFTYREKGLRLVSDLGEEWEGASGLPLPLGAIAVSRRLDKETRRTIDRVLRRSIRYALDNPAASREFVRAHAQELDDDVIGNHIRLFVNGYSLSLGGGGRRAAAEFTGLREEDIFVRDGLDR